MTNYAYGQKRYRGVPCPSERAGLYPDRDFREAREFEGEFDARVAPRGEPLYGITSDEYACGKWFRTLRRSEWSNEVERWARNVADELGWTY